MRCIYIASTPEVRPEDFEVVRERLASEFVGPLREFKLPPLDFAFDAGRGQYASIAVLKMLLREFPDTAWKMLAVTDRDLFVPVLTFVFGQAQLGGRAGVLSLARLRQEFYGLPPNREVFVDRTCKEALHETGHLFGLVHCAERSCAMSLATNIQQIDEKQAAFCPACAGAMRRRPWESV